MVQRIGRIDDMLQAQQGEVVLGEADGMHGVADLVHHVTHLLVLQARLVQNEGPLYVVLDRHRGTLQKGKMYFRFQLKSPIYDSCNFIRRFIRGFFWGTTFVIRLMSHAGIDLKFCFSHRGSAISPDSVFRLNDSLFSRQKNPPIASRQYRFSATPFNLVSWEKSTPLTASISFKTQSSTQQEGTQFLRQNAPRKDARNRHRSIAFSASRAQFSFLILKTRSLNFKEKNSSFSERKLKVVSVKCTMKAYLSCLYGSTIWQKKMALRRRLKHIGVYPVSVNFTLSLPYRSTVPHSASCACADMPRFLMQAFEGTASGLCLGSSQKATSFHPEFCVNKLASSGNLLGSKMRDFMSSRKSILWDISTS